MGENVTSANMSYMQGIPSDAGYAPGPNPSSYGPYASDWTKVIKPLSESLLGVTGAMTKGYAKYSAYGREASYLESEASMAALDARLAAQEADLYDMQGDIIAMQHEINRYQIAQKYLQQYSTNRAKLAKAGVDVWSGSAASVLSYTLEQAQREISIDEMNQSAREFSEVTMPKFRAESKAIALGYKSTTKGDQASLLESAQKTSFGTTFLDLASGGKGGASSLLDFGTKLTEKYA